MAELQVPICNQCKTRVERMDIHHSIDEDAMVVTLSCHGAKEVRKITSARMKQSRGPFLMTGVFLDEEDCDKNAVKGV